MSCSSRHSSSDSLSSMDVGHEEKEEAPCFAGMRLLIISAKLSAEYLKQLISLVQRHDGKLLNESEWQKADVIVTAIGMRKRLERHVSWEVASRKPVVTPKWIEDSAADGSPASYLDYAAIDELKAQMVSRSAPASNSHSSSSAKPTKATISKATPLHPPSSSSFKPRYSSFFACERHSPLICPNQDLVEEFKVIKRAREVDNDKRSMLSYCRAISMLKGNNSISLDEDGSMKVSAYPHRIKQEDEVEKLAHIGPKTLGMISQFLDHSYIDHAQEIRLAQKYRSLFDFNTVYGIGPTTAMKYFNLGLRTFEDLEIYGDIDDPDALAGAEGSQLDGASHGARRLTWIEGLKLRRDLESKIPRDEVEEIGRVVARELEPILPGCEYTICGGFRRGKSESNDVDIIFTHPAGPKQGQLAADLCTKLSIRLKEAGLLTHMTHLPSFRNRAGLPPRPKNRSGWDTLEKVMSVLKLPDYEKHRRVDLIYAPREVYWCAVVGWTGSTQFERDIRLWAKRKKGMKFDSSGITRLRDTKQIFANSEREVFDILGLEWIEPWLRNAD